MKASKQGIRNLSVIVLGDSQVGKTSLILRYTDDKFTGNFVSTLGVDFKLKKLNITGVPIKLQIWDTSGQERFRTITKGYYGKAMGVVLVYDCTDLKSFHEIKNWITQIENHARKDVVKVLIAAKYDKEDIKVTPEMGQSLADDYGIKFFVTSAKTGHNVNEVFSYVAEEIVKQKLDLDETQAEKNAFTIKEKDVTEKTNKKSCCK